MNNLPSFRPRGVVGVTPRGEKVMISPEFQRHLELLTRGQDAVTVSSEGATAVFAAYPGVSAEPAAFAAYPATTGDNIAADYPAPTSEPIFAEY